MLLRCLYSEPKAFGYLKFRKSGNNLIENDELYAFLRKGNEKMGSKDPHTCFFCRKVISTRNNYKMHLKTFHRQTTKLFCDLCPKFYCIKGSLDRHMRDVHSGNIYSCNVCDHKTANKKSLKIHKMIHADKAKCPICKQPVTNLKLHMRAHKPRARCPFCQKMFSNRSLAAHMKLHAGSNAKKCESCNETFANKKDLRRFASRS